MLVPLTREQLATLRHWFRPERPGPLVAQHVLATGNGTCLADRWPDPRALVVQTGGNYTLAGDPGALDPGDLRDRVAGFVEAPAPFEPLLVAAFGEVAEWERMIFTPARPPGPLPPPGAGHLVRRLGAGDGGALASLGEETSWIANTWGGPAGLAASGVGWGAFAGAGLVAVACPFLVGEAHEDLGVATEPGFRGLGLSTICAGEVARDVRRRGRIPTWTTSPDNTASLRVAAKLGFALHHRDRLLVVGIPVPQPARRPSG
jgi:RimJ/RimL family protein N-acetyltransferase